MNKTPRLSKSGIEYIDYSWGIFSGCMNLDTGICPVKNCWAKGLTSHFPKLYPNGFKPTYYPEAIESPKHLRKPSIISVGWVGDVIGYGLKYRSAIFTTIFACPQHKFLFLTKNPAKLQDWAPFPPNAWVGVTATDAEKFAEACFHLKDVEAKVKYFSIEPYLGMIIGSRMDIMLMQLAGIGGVIIGAKTNPFRPPPVGWVQSLALACTKAHIPLFLKDNLKDILPNRMPFWAVYNWTELDKGVPIGMAENRYRQEMPKAVHHG